MSLGQKINYQGCPARQRGLGLVAAIFVITLMALMVVAMSRLLVTSQQSYGSAVLALRAELAAESGAQLAAQAAEPVVGEGRCDMQPPVLSGPAFSGCQVQTRCQLSRVEGVSHYHIASLARCGSGADQAVQKAQLSFWR